MCSGGLAGVELRYVSEFAIALVHKLIDRKGAERCQVRLQPIVENGEGGGSIGMTSPIRLGQNIVDTA